MSLKLTWLDNNIMYKYIFVRSIIKTLNGEFKELIGKHPGTTCDKAMFLCICAIIIILYPLIKCTHTLQIPPVEHTLFLYYILIVTSYVVYFHSRCNIGPKSWCISFFSISCRKINKIKMANEKIIQSQWRRRNFYRKHMIYIYIEIPGDFYKAFER